MRLQLVGNYTLEEFEAAISKIVENFKSNKINSFKGISIYLRTCIDGSEIKFTNDGREVEHLIFDYTKTRQLSIQSAELSRPNAFVVNPTGKEEE